MSAFDAAWYFTLTQEVGEHWSDLPGETPTDADIIAGATLTAAQRRKVGYRSSPEFVGTERKFGIEQGANPRVNVATMGYHTARSTALTVYWNGGAAELSVTKPRTAIMLFDAYFAHGKGNSDYLLETLEAESLSDADMCAAFGAAQQGFITSVPTDVSSNRRRARVSAAQAFALSTPL